MPRTDTVSWRSRQRALDECDQDDWGLDRLTALAQRPVVERYLPRFLAALTPRPLPQPLTALPLTRIQNDERSVIVPQPIRDYVACKAFRLPEIAGVFVVSVGLRRVRVQLVTQRFRWRGRMRGWGAGQELRWLPPGDYAVWQELGQARWDADTEAEGAIKQMFVAACDQTPLVRRASRQARADARRAALIRHGRQALRGLGYLGLALAYLLLLLWCVAAGMWIIPPGAG